MTTTRDPLRLDRAVLQVFPDRTEKTALFDTGQGQLSLPVTAFATVMHLDQAMPRIEIEPIVDEPDYGLITASDLEHDTGWLLVEVQ